jgi:hypothetical protein
MRFITAALLSAFQPRHPSPSEEGAAARNQTEWRCEAVVRDGKPFIMLAGELHNSRPPGRVYETGLAEAGVMT